MMIVHLESVAPNHQMTSFAVQTVDLGLRGVETETDMGVCLSILFPDMTEEMLPMKGGEKIKVTSEDGEPLWRVTVHGTAGELHPQTFDVSF